MLVPRPAYIACVRLAPHCEDAVAPHALRGDVDVERVRATARRQQARLRFRRAARNTVGVSLGVIDKDIVEIIIRRVDVGSTRGAAVPVPELRRVRAESLRVAIRWDVGAV